jgi:hypothetical protein
MAQEACRMDGSRGSAGRSRWGLSIIAWMVFLSGTLLVAEAPAAGKLRISNRYSPLNDERPLRKRTDYIILHTTEGSDQPSLRRVRRGGLAHYLIYRDGRVFRVIHHKREARHAGVSMWNGRKNIDQVSVGIEVVGYHNRPITGQQELALNELIRQLQSLYDLEDDAVLTHSMVAFGHRNRWHKHAHRGRKRCGMLFAQQALRERLGLESRPAFDPDVRAGRLVVGDPYLATLLYATERDAVAVAESRFEGPDANVITKDRTAWFIARDEYDAPSTVYVFPGGARKRGSEIRDWSRIPRGTRVMLDQELAGARPWRVLGEDGTTASELAGEAYASATTIYVRPDGRLYRGDQMDERTFRKLPPGTRVLVGFRLVGEVTRNRTAYELCGPAFRNDTTLYVLPGGAVRNGTEIRENRIPGGTRILVAT